MNYSDRIPDEWSDAQKTLFVRLYEHMLQAAEFFHHPDAQLTPIEHWDTTAWNAAWVAALFSEGCAPLEHRDTQGRTMMIEGAPKH